MSGTLNQPAELDRYSFPGRAGQRIYFDALSPTNRPGLTARLIGPQGSQIHLSGADQDFGPLTLLESGSHVLEIRSEEGATGEYRCRLLDADAAAAAMTLNATLSDQLSPPLAAKLFRFDAVPGQRLQLLGGGASGTSGFVTVVDAANQHLVGGNLSFVGDQGNAVVGRMGPVLVIIANSDPSGSSLNFILRLNVNDPAPTVPAGFGVIREGAVVEGQVETFSFAAPAGTPIALDGLLDDSQADAYIEFQQPDGGILAQFASSRQDAYPGSGLPLILPLSGNYTVRVYGPGFPPNTGSGNYRFRLLNLNDVPAASAGDTLTIPGAPYRQTDVYRLAAASGKQVSLDWIQPGDGTTLVHLLGDGSILRSSYDPGDPLPALVPLAGHSYVIIQRTGESPGEVRLRLHDLATAVPVAFDTDIRATLDPAPKTEWYRLSGTAGQRLVLRSLEGSDASVVVEVFRPSMELLTVPWMGNNQEIELPDTGTYHVRVSAQATSGPALPFGFRINTPDTAVRPLTLGAVTTAATTEPRERLEYRFQASYGQRFYLDALSATEQGSFHLIGTGGRTETSGAFSSDFGPFTANASGLWTLRLVFDSGFATGEVAFRLLDIAQPPVAALSPGTVVRGVLNQGANLTNATLVYRMPVTAGQRLFYDHRTNSGFAVRIMGPHDQGLHWSTFSQDFPDLTMPSSGDAVVAVSADGSGPTAYEFSLQVPLRSSQALTFGAVQTLTLANVGDQAVFTISATAGQVAYFDALSPDDESKGIAVFIASDSGEYVNQTTFGYDVGPFRFPRTGTYQVRIGGSNDSLGQVSFRLLSLQAAPEIPADTEVTGVLTAPRGAAVYRFQAGANERVRFESLSAGAGLSTWSIYGPEMTVLRSGNLTLDLPETSIRSPGLHYLVLAPNETTGNLAGDQSFRIRRRVASEPAQGVTGLGDVKEGTLDPLGNVEFLFTAPAGHRVFYDALMSAGNFNLSLQFNGITLGSAPANQDGNFSGAPLPLVLPYSGTYTVRIEDTWGSGGSYRFAVLDAESAPTVTFASVLAGQPPLEPLQTRLLKLSATAGQILFADWLMSTLVTLDVSNPSGLNTANVGYAYSFLPIIASGDHILRLWNPTESEAPWGLRLLDLSGSGSAPVALDTPVNVTLPAQEVRVFRIGLVEGQKIFLDYPAGLTTYPQLFPPGSIYGITGSTSSSDLSYVTRADGLHYLVVPNEGDSPLEVTFRAVDGVLTAQPVALDSATHAGSLATPGAERRFLFNAAAGQRIFFDTRTTAAVSGQTFFLLPPGGGAPVGQWAPYQDFGPFTLPAGGEWTLLLENGADTALDYSFRLINVDQAPRLVWDTPMSTDLPPGEARIFQFAADAGQRVTFRGPPSGLPVTGTVYRRDDTWGGSIVYVNPDSTLLRMTLGDSRDHLLVLSSSGDTTVSYAVTPFLGNHPPVLAEIPGATLDEGVAHSVTASATDPEQPNDRIRFSLGGAVPGGAAIDAVTGQFTWTPSEAHGPGGYVITVVATDDGLPPLSTSRPFTLTVLEVNQPPLLSPIPAQTVAEGSALVFSAAATDPDRPVNPLTYSLAGTVPEGATLDPVTGSFAWTPTEAQGPGSYTFDVVVTDASGDARAPQLSDRKPVTVTVTEVNQAPVLNEIGSLKVDELQPLSVTPVFRDDDLPPNRLAFSLGAGSPPGLSIDPVTGVISWTPSEAQGPGTYPVTVILSDGGSADAANPVLSATRSLTIEVREVNEEPTLPEFAEVRVVEGAALALNLSGSDLDLPPQRLTYRLLDAPPPGTAINETTGEFTWTPSEAQGPSTNQIIVAVSDNYAAQPLGAQRSFSVIVLESNLPPVLAVVSNQRVGRGESLSVDLDATDADLPPQTLTYDLVSGPSGLDVTAAGVISWTPDSAQRPSTNVVRVRVSDGTVNDEKTFEVIAEPENRPPVLAEIPDQRIPEEAPWSLQSVGSDPDLPPQTLTYSLAPELPGLSISPAGVLSWTPAESQGPSTNSVTVRLSDGTASAERTFFIVVTEANKPPVLAEIAPQTIPEEAPWAFQLVGSDPDLPGQNLIYSLVTELPGLIISPAGVVSWTPSEALGPSTNSVTVRLGDGITSAERTFLLVVTEVNKPPVLAEIVPQTIPEEVAWSLALTGSDPDLPAQDLSYSLVAELPGLSISTAGVLSWTPTEAQGPSTNSVTIRLSDGTAGAERAFLIIVTEANKPPVLTEIAPQTIPEEAPWSFQLAGSDPDIPSPTLTYGLATGPAGLEVSTAGLIAWTPSGTQGPSTNRVTVTLSDGLAETNRSFTIVVTENIRPPSLAEIPDQETAELAPWTWALVGSDPNDPPKALTYSVVLGPNGLTVSNAGLLAWTPTEPQGPSTNTVTVRVSNGTLGAERTFRVVVTETNLAPILDPIPDQDIVACVPWVFPLVATDADLPPQTLTFSIEDHPPELTISTEGMISWTPPCDQRASTNTISVCVSDGIERVCRTVVIRVPAPVPEDFAIALSPFDPDSGQLELRWPSQPGQRFQIEFQTSLDGSSWQPLGEAIVAAAGITSARIDTAGADVRLLRVVRLP